MAGAGDTVVDGKIKALVAAISTSLTAEVRQTLPKIQGLPLQVLALRRYLRIGRSATEKWAWTQKHYDEFNLSHAGAELRRSIEAVKTKFEKDNPGYVLGIAAKFRPLDHQIKKFCGSAKVQNAAAMLMTAVLVEIKSYPENIDQRSVEKFRQFLKSYHFSKKDEPSVAAPGISDHGRGQAIDFIVYKDGKQIAGPSVDQIPTVWIGQGFGAKLNQAVRTSPNVFNHEHLKTPFEPWHYDLQKV